MLSQKLEEREREREREREKVFKDPANWRQQRPDNIDIGISIPLVTSPGMRLTCNWSK